MSEMLVTEATVRRSSSKKVFFKISKCSRENTHVGASLLKRDSNTGVFLWNCDIFKNSFFYRTPSVDAYVVKEFIVLVKFQSEEVATKVFYKKRCF